MQRGNFGGGRRHDPTAVGSPSGLERAGAGLVLLLLLPLFLLLWTLVRVTLGGPAITQAPRPGRRAAAPGLRFRTTVSQRRFGGLRDLESAANSPRHGRVGAAVATALSRTGLDGLPALWDLARGTGATAGPPSLAVQEPGLRLVTADRVPQPVSRP